MRSLKYKNIDVDWGRASGSITSTSDVASFPDDGARSNLLRIRDVPEMILDDPCCCFSAEDFAEGSSEPDIDPKKTSRQRGRSGPGLLRYPGGKSNVVGKINSRLQTLCADLSPMAEYREPFLGSGAVAISFLKHQPGRPAWLNDRDPAMATLWDCVLHRSARLKWLIEELGTVLSVGTFENYKRKLLTIADVDDLRRHDPSLVGLAKLAIHQASYSGLGTRSGGPLGGSVQRGVTKIDSRYNPELLCRKMNSCREILTTIRLRNATCTCVDFEKLFMPGEAFFYLDPPYYKAGPDLYQHSFGHEDHLRLADLLRAETRPWLLSYDPHPVILNLYTGWSRIEKIEVPYSINGCAKKEELLISGR
jgi:DNA adenine methylase